MAKLNPAWNITWFLVVTILLFTTIGIPPTQVEAKYNNAHSKKSTLSCSTNEALALLNIARKHYDANDYQNAFISYNYLFGVCKNSVEVVERTINLAVTLKKYDLAKNLISKVTSKHVLSSDDFVASVINLYSRLGHLDIVCSKIKNITLNDPDNKKMIKKYKIIRDINNNLKTLRKCYSEERSNNNVYKDENCVKSLESLNVRGILNFINKENLFSSGTLIHTFNCIMTPQNAKNYRTIKKECEFALDSIKEDSKATLDSSFHKIDIFLANAKALMELNKYKDAQLVLEYALKEYHNNSDLLNLLKKCKHAIRNNPEDDYYSTLGVSKNATTEEILSAYKKLAIKNHPDKKKEGPERDEAMEEMIKINKARDVLTNPEKRNEYDNRGMYENFNQNMNFNSFNNGNYIYTHQSRPERFIIRNNPGGGEQFIFKISGNRRGSANDNPFGHIIETIFADTGF